MNHHVSGGASVSASVTATASRGISLTNTVQSDVAPSLPLPSLPVFFGAADPELRLTDESVGLNARRDVTAQCGKIAELLRQADVSYLNLREDVLPITSGYVDHLELHDEILRCDPQAFDCITAGHVEGQTSSFAAPARTPIEPSGPVSFQAQRDYLYHHQPDIVNNKDISSVSSRKTRVKKKGSDGISSSVRPDPSELQETTIASFCELLEDICHRAELTSEDCDEVEWLSLPVADLRILVNEISVIRAKKLLQLVPVEILVRLLRVLDQQIHRAEGLSMEDSEHSDTHAASLVFCALESIHAALGVMACSEMPKQLYKEEIIERILEFTRHQITDVMSAYDPTYRALHKPCDNGAVEVDEDEEFDGDFSSSSKKRRKNRSSKAKRVGVNKVSAAVHTALQKLCTILVLLKDLLLIERLSDSCILQLLKTSLTTFLVDNIHLLQLKAIGMISGIFYSYTQHRTYVIDEVIQLFWKLPISKRALKAYHLHEEQKQIQTITALIIQLVHSSANLPAALRQTSSDNPISEVSIDCSYLTKCHEAVSETCCMFWTRVLQRLTSVKAQEASELKLMIENLVVDLLTTLNLPEYPAAAPLLEVLSVLLLQNAGLKSKDISARCIAIDILGTIAARLKSDVIRCHQEKFWILQKMVDHTGANSDHPTSTCTICLGGRSENSLFICQGCEGLFHYDCVGMREHETTGRSLFCQFCMYKKQLLVLHSYCKSQSKIDGKYDNYQSDNNSQAADAISNYEIVQQILLSYLQDFGSSDDLHLFVRWFYLCLWSKNDPNYEQNYNYYLARLKSKEIVRDSGIGPSTFTRDSIKKITLALGQNNSFSRGFEKILHMFLASLKENSPLIRAKALRAVSIIVEADPEVLRYKLVQLAVEGRFCDSAISVREAALELVGRHIASHPDVGLQYFEKVAERIKDTGVSVRKRAIKIIRDMCTSNANFSEYTSACIEIISRVSDDESSIQDLVCKTFYEFWFEEPSGSQTQYYGDGSSVPLEVAKKTDQIVETLKRLPNHQLLVTVIKRNLVLDFTSQSAKASGINPLSLASVRKRCELMCKCLLEKILQVREMNSEEAEVLTVPYVLVLHAFCIVDPTLCAPSSDPSMFVVTLQPYLKTQVDDKKVAKLLESIIFIIDAVLPLLRKLPLNVSEELEQDLKHMIVRHSFLTVVHACIRCLCTLSKVAGKGAAVVEYLIQLFFKRLDSQGADNNMQVGRSLFCVGLLLRYGISLLNTSCNKKIDIGGSLRLFKRYLQVDDFGIKVRSLQALGYVLIARPDFMLEEDIKRILEATLSAGSEDRIKMQALQNIYEYLLDAERQLGTDQDSTNVVDYSVESGQSVPVAAGAGDTNICGGIIQLYWNNILDRCVDYKGHVRQSALKIVEVALRQGLIHPVTCVPHLIALETDPLEVNFKLAHHLLISMNEKHPAFFESRLGDGLQMSFAFMQSISGSAIENQHNVSATSKGKPDGTFSQARLGVSRIYKLIRGNRASRNRFMASVVRKFDSPSWSDTIIQFLRYCTEILALLPFTVPDEPLYLIYTINRVIQVRAGALEANMKSLLQSLQKYQLPQPRDNGIFPGHPVNQPMFNYMNLLDTDQAVKCEAAPNLAYMHMSSVDLNVTFQQPSYTHTISNNMTHMDNGEIQLDGSNKSDLNPSTPMNANMPCESSQISGDLLTKIQADCLAATALQLLMKLKRHLKIVHALDNARCQAFSPNEVPKPGESLAKQNIPFDIGDTKSSLPTTYPEFVQRFQEFKNALKEDTIDYSIFTANIKRKRPTPRKGSKSGRMNGRDCEDEDYDEDWTGGRRLSYSVRKGSSRGTRQQRMFL